MFRSSDTSSTIFLTNWIKWKCEKQLLFKILVLNLSVKQEIQAITDWLNSRYANKQIVFGV